ncbi:MAG TPA: carboxypeptidase-like regulatory domain-containing protein, partial [Vicinamibacteria bacterium]|nr:carboxypeptidase-like regulatory domain-containing protein [Vicinamibacteria bacterium]
MSGGSRGWVRAPESFRAPAASQDPGAGVVPVVLERVFEPAEAEDLGEVEVPVAEALAGRVVDGSGGPVVGATVTLWGGDTRTFGRGAPAEPVPFTATTGADGSFRHARASERGNRIRVEAPGLAVAEASGLRSGA